MKLGSLFDGIGGWLIAAKRHGVEPVWASEIAEFPRAVTLRHFPDVIQLGDITKLNGAEIPPVDIICAGSPCQNLSVAGNREGLDGEQSGLFHKAIEIIRQMRKATGNKYPRVFVWENVPGAFSSNHSADYRAVLEEITEAEIPMPENNKWADAGMVEWDGGSLAWRVLDAQYWGVPQRRKRIFLVANFAAGERRAGEILFEREGVPRDFAEGGKARESTAAGVAGGVGATVVRMRAGKPGGGKGALISRDKSLTLAANANDQILFAAGFKAGAGSDAGGVGYEVEKATTLTAATSGTQRPTVAVYGVGLEGSVAGTLDASYYKGPGNRSGKERCAICVYDMTHADEVMRRVEGGKCQTLNARMGTGGNQVPVIAFREASFGSGGMGSGSETCVCQKTVRRLTPLEAERLQGLPDNYTLIDDRSCSDTARYKALGNGMAQPCADYVMRRIVEVCNENK